MSESQSELADQVDGKGRQERRRLTLGTKILIGILLGIACGVFFGDLSEPFTVIGNVYVGLLQMTVLPYVTVALVSKIGSLTYHEARRLAGQAGIVLLALWAISMIPVLVLPVSLPQWDAATFFTSSLVERPQDFDFLDLYLPVNPFHSLANNIVPAAVLFSILVGGALIGVSKKERILEPFEVLGESLSRISGFVVRLSPWGTFALSAGAAGSLSPEQLTRLMGYVSSYSIAVIYLTFLVLPGLTAAVTPIRFGQLIAGFRDSGLTAFAIGKLFAVLPMVVEDAKRLLIAQGVSPEEAEAKASVFVPLAYPFPNSGKVLTLLFIPFGAWFVGRSLELTDFPLLLSIGLLTIFGSPVAAIPFLLDLFRLPTNLFPLFLIAGIWCARVGDVLGTMHLTVFTLLCAAWNGGWLRLQPARLADVHLLVGCHTLDV